MTVKKLTDSDTRLRIYLDDHAALMLGELELMRRCQRSNRNSPLNDFLQRMYVEVQAQRAVVKDVMHRVGVRRSLLKASGAWLAEKVGRTKLNGTILSYSSLSRVLELETLAAAAVERIAVWDNLDAIGAADERLAGISFDFFRQQAERHLEEINQRRRQAAIDSLKIGT